MDMQQDSSWTYGPNGLPVENVPPHAQPTLVMAPVPLVRPPKARRRWFLRFGLALLVVLLILAGSGLVFWTNPAALGWVSGPFMPSNASVVPWNGSDPINILALGEDQRYPGEKTHSDTIIVMQITPGSGKV